MTVVLLILIFVTTMIIMPVKNPTHQHVMAAARQELNASLLTVVVNAVCLLRDFARIVIPLAVVLAPWDNFAYPPVLRARAKCLSLLVPIVQLQPAVVLALLASHVLTMTDFANARSFFVKTPQPPFAVARAP
jgi:hypothetical protein